MQFRYVSPKKLFITIKQFINKDIFRFHAVFSTLTIKNPHHNQ